MHMEKTGKKSVSPCVLEASEAYFITSNPRGVNPYTSMPILADGMPGVKCGASLVQMREKSSHEDENARSRLVE